LHFLQFYRYIHCFLYTSLFSWSSLSLLQAYFVLIFICINSCVIRMIISFLWCRVCDGKKQVYKNICFNLVSNYWCMSNMYFLKAHSRTHTKYTNTEHWTEPCHTVFRNVHYARNPIQSNS
jgi:hypothetical protein